MTPHGRFGLTSQLVCEGVRKSSRDRQSKVQVKAMESCID